MDFMNNGPENLEDSSFPGSDKVQGVVGEKKKLTALELARALCQSFVAMPVKSLIMGEDESQSVRRIATVMSTQFAQVAVPLRDYLDGPFNLPIAMHDIVKEGVTLFPGMYAMKHCYFFSRHSFISH